jgi:alcohol dehydrogenase class IV
MSPITLIQPVRIVFGDGCAPQCAEFLAQRGVRRVLLVSSTPVLPTLGGLLEVLSKASVAVVQSPLVDREPTCRAVEEVLTVARRENVEALLGIGGGSALDVAKLVAALARGHQTVSEVLGVNLLAGRSLPLVCLPTTAGTGSEVSPNAILLDEADELKKGVVSPHLVPDAAFVDPLLTHSVPSAVTAATGMDALTHCIEAFANKFAHPLVDGYALQGNRLIAANLERAVRHGKDPEARAGMALGSLCGGLCLGPVNTGAVHALAYPLGGRFHIPHGVSNAALLPHVLRFNLPSAPGRYAAVAAALGVAGKPTEMDTATHGIERIVRTAKACGLPQRLSALGVPLDAIPEMARAAMQVTRLLKNNLRPVTEADAIQIYQAAF